MPISSMKVSALLLAMVCICTFSSFARAQQAKGAVEPTTSAREDQPLVTDREKQLLERIEALEKRVDELSARQATSKVAGAQATPTNSSRSQSGTQEVAGAPSVSGSSVTAAAAPAAPVGSSAQLAPSAAQPQAPQKPDPFSFADFTWLTGNPRTTESPLTSKLFTGEFRVDTDYVYDYNHPSDHTIGGSSEIFRSGEVQVTQLGVGGDLHWNNVRGRLMTQFGMYSFTTPRNDASPVLGQWDLATAYRYVSEAYGGYHFNKWYGINVDAGIFMSYVGLFSYYNFDNWAYQPSYVSSNTPWFFNGVRIQIFPTEKLKIEPWIVNGWQSYGKFNKAPGWGLQILYRPTGWLSILGNQYYGTDALGVPGRKRIHTDDSIQIKYYDNPDRLMDKAAMTFTFDAGCEFGKTGGVSCTGAKGRPAQYFLGFMTYQRFWLYKDLFAFTLGGGAINNPGRSLVLLPPINGATAITGSPYFTENPGDPYRAWDTSATFDYMPKQFITWRIEFNHRAANVPYFSGNGGITPPGGNTATPAVPVPDWSPDLRKAENRIIFAILVKM